MDISPSGTSEKSNSLKRQGSYFLFVGGVATALQYLILIMLVELIGLDAVTSSSIGFGVSSLLNYYLNYHVTFKSKAPHHLALPKFLIVASVGLVLNGLFMFLFSENLSIHYFISQLLSTGFVLLWNFTVNKIWTFKL